MKLEMKLTTLAIFTLLILNGQANAGTYNGPPDWRAPKAMTCHGISDFPSGLKVTPSEVFGGSSDEYLFSEMAGALGFYYFEMKYPPKDNVIYGLATFFDRTRMEWPMKEYKANCKVTEWK